MHSSACGVPMHIMSCQLKLSLTCVQVPRSSKAVAEDNDNALFTVTLFRRVADTFKTAARTRGFQVTAHMQHMHASFVANLTCPFTQPLLTIPCALHPIRCRSCAGWHACCTLHCMLCMHCQSDQVRISHSWMLQL